MSRRLTPLTPVSHLATNGWATGTGLQKGRIVDGKQNRLVDTMTNRKGEIHIDNETRVVIPFPIYFEVREGDVLKLNGTELN